MSVNVIRGKVEEGVYQGKSIEVHFGRPMKILVDGKDVTEYLVALQINLDANGQVIYLTIAEMAYSQVPPKAWEKMVDDKIKLP